MGDLELNFLRLCIPMWAFYSGSDLPLVVPFVPTTNARDRTPLSVPLPPDSRPWESVSNVKVNLKTRLFPSVI